MLYAFFWVIPKRLNFIYRRFGTLSVPPIKMEKTEYSERRNIRFRRQGITHKKAYNIYSIGLLSLLIRVWVRNW